MYTFVSSFSSYWFRINNNYFRERYKNLQLQSQTYKMSIIIVNFEQVIFGALGSCLQKIKPPFIHFYI